MKFKRLLVVLAVLLAILGVVCFIGLGVVLADIHHAVDDTIGQARAQFPEASTDVQALIAVMDTEDRTLSQRNRAIWTLGRLSDPAALPALEAHYTGALCDHATGLCQYELEKAIVRCGGQPDPPRQTRANH